jgi:hypothetical protein
MPEINGVRGLADLPGFDRIAEVASDWGEPVVLRGSAARRLAVHLMEKRPLDHALPARCSPPPSDLDLLFETDDGDRIGDILADIRDTAPIFQAVRVEASSLPKIEKLQVTLAEHVHCPILGVSLPLENDGFDDPSDEGLRELADGRPTFALSPTALENPQRLDDELRFHVYAACLVYAKAVIEHGRFPSDGLGAADDFCAGNVGFVTELAEADPYYRTRLLGIGYSLRAMAGRQNFEKLYARLLPDRFAKYLANRPESALFHIGKTQLYTSTGSWTDPDKGLGDVADLTFSTPLAASPEVPLLLGTDEPGTYLDCLVPMWGPGLEAYARSQEDYAAALHLTIRQGHRTESIWLPALCEGHPREELCLRVPMDEVAGIVAEVGRVLGGSVDASIRIHLLGRNEAAGAVSSGGGGGSSPTGDDWIRHTEAALTDDPGDQPW